MIESGLKWSSLSDTLIWGCFLYMTSRRCLSPHHWSCVSYDTCFAHTDEAIKPGTGHNRYKVSMALECKLQGCYFFCVLQVGLISGQCFSWDLVCMRKWECVCACMCVCVTCVCVHVCVIHLNNDYSRQTYNSSLRQPVSSLPSEQRSALVVARYSLSSSGGTLLAQL